MLTINNTLDGYLKDVEILGNTIQNEEDLADIRSVGNKVEGQELYEIPVLSCGKNLCREVEHFGINISNGQDNTGIGNRTNYIRVKQGLKYTFSKNNVARTCVKYYYNKNKEFIRADNTITDAIFTIPQDVCYLRLSWGVDIEEGNYQLEEGTVATPYEPYQEDKLTILSPTPLEKVGDVRDRIIEKDGVLGVEKNVGELKLENLAMKSITTTDTTYRVYLGGIINIKTPCKYGFGTSLCNMLPFIPGEYYTRDEEHYYLEDVGDVFLFIDKNKFDGTKEGLNKYLEGKGYVIKYQLATPQFIPLPHDQQVKLRTFANKTNISFLTEIEGTIKAQVPKSLGATVNTHTTQISNLNKELDRVKKLEESTVSTVTTESDFTTVEATSNGYFEDVKLEGKTLVNLVDYSNNLKNIGSSVCTSIKNNQYYKFEVTQTGSLFSLIKTLYDVSNKDITLIIDNKSNFNPTLYKRTGYAFIKNLVSGLNVIKVNTDSLTEGFGIGSLGDRVEGDVLEYSIIILEGDHTQNPPNGYIEGLKSVGEGVDEIVVSSVNENLFDGKLSLGYLNGNGIVSPHETWVTSDFINIQGVPQLNFESTVFNGVKSIGLYDSDKEFVDYIYNVKTPVKIGKTVKYVRISMCKNPEVAPTQYELDNPCITMYINSKTDKKHQSDKKRLLYYNEETQTWEKPILREWDSIEKHSDGKYYYHVRSKEGDYVEGDESLNDCITDLTVSVKKLAEEKVYECTNIDLITYTDETNYIVESGAIAPKSILKVHNNISNVVSLLQKKVSILDDKVTGILINAQIAEDETSIVGNKLNLTTDKYQVTNMVNNTQIVLPTVDKFTEIHLFFDATSDMTLVYPEVKWQTVPIIKANASYEFIFTYVNDAWLGGFIVRK